MKEVKEVKVYIHTLGRSTDQQTLDRLSKRIRKKTWLVVQRHERKLYNYPRVLVLPREIRMLSPTRQWILENADSDKIVMMDDDLAFYRRKSEDDWHLKYCKSGDINDLFELLEDWLDDVAHCGVSPREGNNRVEELYSENTRMTRILAYNVPKVMEVGARFDRIDTKQDFDMTLQLLRAGFKNRVSYEFAQGQWRSSDAAGGCSTYRTEDMMVRCAEELAELHPGFVNVTKKKTKTAWKKYGGVRTDVTIYWKKAYESSHENHTSKKRSSGASRRSRSSGTGRRNTLI